MSRRRIVIALCLCLLGGCVSSAQAAPTWLPAQALSSPMSAPFGVEPTVAMGPSGDIAAAWSDEGSIVTSVRKAGSEHAIVEVVPGQAGAPLSPNAAVNAAGEVVVAWFDKTAQRYEIALRKPNKTFSEPIAAGPAGSSNAERPSVAIDAAGDVLVGESSLQSGAYAAVYAWRPAGGVFKEVTVSEAGHETGPPSVALDSAGDAIVAWWEHVSSGASPTIARALLRAAGGSFGTPQSLSHASEYAFNLQAAIGAAGASAVVWQRGTNVPPYRIEASTSPAPTQPLGEPQTISATGGEDEVPAVTVGGNGATVAAWQQLSAPHEEQLAVAPAPGAGFAPALAAGQEGNSGTPALAGDAAGDALLAWGAEAGGADSVHAVTRSAAGVLSADTTLSASGERVDFSLGSTTPGVPVAVAMDSDGDALVGWERFSDNTVLDRIYDATGPTLKLEAPASATVGQPVTFKAIAHDLFSGVAAVSWSFGDGSGTEGTGPTHVYANPGTYTVNATATDGVGNATSVSGQVTITPASCAGVMIGGSCSTICAVPAFACAPGAQSGGCGPIRQPANACRRCVVPHLVGLSETAAKRRLQAADCRLGKVKVAKRYKHARRLVVKTQSPKAGRVFKGTIVLTLKPAPPPRHKHRRR
jgi:hypothetical protein